MRKLILGFVACLGWACGDSSGPGTPPVPGSQLHFIAHGPTMPPLLDTSGSFWAKSGTDREIRLYYAGAAPGDTGESFLRFKVPGDGLFKRPDGSLFHPGDSVLITVTANDPSRFIFSFQPSGLAFNAAHPAELDIDYGADLDGDGQTHTAADDSIEARLNLWRREPPDTLWMVVGSLKLEALDEIDAKIYGFTQYAVAW